VVQKLWCSREHNGQKKKTAREDARLLARGGFSSEDQSVLETGQCQKRGGTRKKGQFGGGSRSPRESSAGCQGVSAGLFYVLVKMMAKARRSGKITEEVNQGASNSL